MNEQKSQADIIRAGEGLLDAGERSPDVLETDRERQAVAGSLADVKTLKAQQEELTAQRQETTQKLRAAIARLKDDMLVYRTVVRGKIGPRSERLVHFNITPLRKRVRKQAEVVKLPNGEASGTKPDASASPSAKSVV